MTSEPASRSLIRAGPDAVHHLCSVLRTRTAPLARLSLPVDTSFWPVLPLTHSFACRLPLCTSGRFALASPALLTPQPPSAPALSPPPPPRTAHRHPAPPTTSVSANSTLTTPPSLLRRLTFREWHECCEHSKCRWANDRGAEWPDARMGRLDFPHRSALALVPHK